MAYYRGRVFRHPDYIKYLEDVIPEVAVFTAAFVEFWKNGFHPLIGKGGVMTYPDIYSEQAIGRVHIEPPVKLDDPYSATADCWRRWASGDETLLVFPTSNKFLMFCVDANRDACLLGYLDGDDRDAHEVIKDPSYRRDMKARAESFFRSRRSSPMSPQQYEDARLFGDEWLTDLDDHH